MHDAPILTDHASTPWCSRAHASPMQHSASRVTSALHSVLVFLLWTIPNLLFREGGLCFRTVQRNRNMRNLDVLTTRLATLILLNAAGAGLAAPSVLVTRPISKVSVEWLPMDNQTLYRLEEGESRNLELNTSLISQMTVYITVSPCSRHMHWAFYRGPPDSGDSKLQVVQEHGGGEMHTLSFSISKRDRYVLQLSSSKGGAASVSVRGEATRLVRLRLRVRSKRRLSANWDPSPIDPQTTTYCVVASHRKNYTSLCAAQHDVRSNRCDNKPNRFNSAENRSNERLRTKQNQTDKNTGFSNSNKIDADIDGFNIYDGNFKSIYRRKKFGRSTRVSNEDPVIACVGERTHHLIDNLDPSTTYFVSIFGVARDRRIGTLLTTGSVRPRTSTAKKLKENVQLKADIKGKSVYYLKTTVGSGGGLWLAASTCGGSIDIDVSVKGKRLYLTKNIEPHLKFFIPAPIASSSIQETSDEGSVQFDSSSEESKIRYVIRILPNKWYRDLAVTVELTASTARWGVSTPELPEDGGKVLELRPKRSCNSVDIAFLPASHNATDVIRYCILTREILNNDNFICALSKKSPSKMPCTSHLQRPPTRAIIQKVTGLKPGRKYAVQVTAASKGSSVPYKVIYVETNVSCKEE
ncbi:jg14557 [Pararge aegeria aegeria]|uniref:Jg14557 protein n=1 Tax=Pararge aegeria aegeria TaxID=348720 RepID=A0A8S4RE88_9NEOP|nr:jg14557 [Pararge aegeria aegeria]CAH2235075.1 jg14557 [Pararge aegeria aegeria]